MRCRFAQWVIGVVYLFAPTAARSATVALPVGGDLQAALNVAQPGDVITLEPDATYTGNYVLPNKGNTFAYITIRSAAPDAAFPDSGVRMTPAYAAQLPKIKSPNGLPALRTAASANHYKLMFLEFQANLDGLGDIISIGAGDLTQTDVSQVPYAFILDRLYVHGDPEKGQKRGIALHSSDTTVTSSWVSDCKAIGQDSQAIGGFNGPGQYVIENNYLEAAGENFLLGGADPPIANLVTTNVVFRYNYLSKPLAWRLPILTTPADVIAAATPGGGVLPAGTYYYKVVARKVGGQARTVTSIASADVPATLDVDGAVTISWTPVVGAQDYLVYGRTSNTQNLFWTTTNPYFTDIGDAGSAGQPSSGTKWLVKNIFELKNAQDILVVGNVFENLWVAGQPGFPIVFTPRNQNGRAPWVVVQRVTFQNNLVRHTAGGVNILGIDSPNPSQRTNNIIIRNNVFDDLTARLWGVSRVFQLGNGPDAVTIDHNLAVGTQSAIHWLYGGSALAPKPITNLTITNNMSPHNSFGLDGNNFSPGLTTFNAYMLPNGIFCHNVLAGGNVRVYPSTGFGCDNFFPTVVQWQGDFVNYAAGDYHLIPTGRIGIPDYPSTGPDLGADFDAVLAETTLALSGDIRLQSAFPAVHIITTSLPNGKYHEAYNQSVMCTPALGPCAWEVLDSSMPAGLVFDAASGTISGTPLEAAAGSLTLRAYDTAWRYNDATAKLSITVDAPNFVISMPQIPAGKVGEPFQLAPTVSGAMGTVTWTIVSGALPAGIGLDALSGVIAGIPTVWGTTVAVLQAQDSSRVNRTDAKTVTITVAPAAIAIPMSALPAGLYDSPYQAILSATGGTGSYSWSVVGGDVPFGLVVDASGLVSGVPQRVGLFTFILQANDANSPANTATATVSLEVVPTPFSVSVPAVPQGVVGSPYSLTASASGQVGSVVWSIASGQLPPGLAIDATGTISGVPAAFGSFTALVQARDSYSEFRTVDVSVTRTADVNVTIVIAPLP